MKLQELKNFSGRYQWHGPHLLAIIRYAMTLCSNSKYHRYRDQWRYLDDLAHKFELNMSLKKSKEILSSMPEPREFFTVPKLQSTPKTNEILARFIYFLVETLQEIWEPSKWLGYTNVVVPSHIDVLLMNLKFLVPILGDTPFQSELEESKNILAIIESIANKAGIFLYSFFFTTDIITETELDVALSVLLPKFEMVEAKIKEHCITVSKLPSFTTRNMASVSIFIVDSVLDDFNHLINHKAHLVVDVKDQIATLHEELKFSRSFLKDIEEVQQNNELIECAMKLRDLAYEADYVITWFVGREVPFWYVSLRLSNFIQKSEQIRTAFHEIKPNSGIRSVQVSENPSEVSPRVVKRFPVDDEIMVGFEEKMTQIAGQLVGGRNHLQLISIIGMPGIGKTTLAKKLYNHSYVIHRFDMRLWCVVSQTYRKTNVLIDILTSITNVKEEEILKMEDGELVERLYKNLKGRRYLLVMDDLWNKEAWDDLKRYFPDDKNGSRILFTSRNKDVVSQASSGEYIHKLPLLSDNKCWDLLQKKVFQKGLCPPELQDIGKEIATNCKGLPLAVVGIAGVLANMAKEVSLWQEVATSLSSYISKHQEIVELSYKHLPTHLKPCFLYFSIFNKDREIPIRKLLSEWISQGFIPKKRDKRLEDIAEDYLTELINRSMVQVVKRRCDNGVKACNIHDLIRDMCMRIAKEENFLKVIQDEFSIYEQHHHIRVDYYSHHDESSLFGLHIHSLCCDKGSLRVTSRLKLLRVLKSVDPPDKTASEFLVKLRYLDTQWFGKTFCMLENREFLVVRGHVVMDIVLLTNMPKLRHLYFKEYVRLSGDWDISQTNSLETLSGIYIFHFNDEKLLKHFPHLRHLKCQYGIDSPDLSFLTQLESLKIGSDVVFHVAFTKINFPTNIKKLSLNRIFLSCEMMSSIGRLPNLEILKIYGFALAGGSWNTNDDEFQKLKFLKLHNLHFEQWNISSNHFPELERLVLRRCYRPKVIPSELGFIPTLQMIEVDKCNEYVRNSAMQIQKEQEENGNDELKVIISGTVYDSDSE